MVSATELNLFTVCYVYFIVKCLFTKVFAWVSERVSGDLNYIINLLLLLCQNKLGKRDKTMQKCIYNFCTILYLQITADWNYYILYYCCELSHLVVLLYYVSLYFGKYVYKISMPILSLFLTVVILCNCKAISGYF